MKTNKHVLSEAETPLTLWKSQSLPGAKTKNVVDFRKNEKSNSNNKNFQTLYACGM